MGILKLPTVVLCGGLLVKETELREHGPQRPLVQIPRWKKQSCQKSAQTHFRYLSP